MSDIDTRIRWRAAHCLRRAARLRLCSAVEATIRQMDRSQESTFRDGAAPFYFVAAKLWVMLAMYRISAESPAMLSPFKDAILGWALSPDLPHVGIREYAKRTLMELNSAGVIALAASEIAVLREVNRPLKGQTSVERTTPASYNQVKDDALRFRFDQMDTLPYWYNDILRIFPTVSADQILDIADQWIRGKWGASAEANWWKKEPRKARYDERRFNRWSHRHGSYPQIERYGTYLEWNAMHCVVGELLATHPVAKTECHYRSLNYWFGHFLPTSPPAWLADYRGPTPLETRIWVQDSGADDDWLQNINGDDVLMEIGALDSSRPGWLVVDCHYDVHFPKRETSVRISTALVSPSTGAALVRALQTASNPWDFRIPYEDDDLAIAAPPYRLSGWIGHVEADDCFDRRDPFRYEVSSIRVRPGRGLTKMLDLERRVETDVIWVRKRGGEAALMYEAWCDEPPSEEDYSTRNINSAGWRFLARTDVVQSYLLKKNMDLICEIQISRRLRSEDRRSYDSDEKQKTHNKIILLRAQGELEDANGHIGAWATHRQGVGS